MSAALAPRKVWLSGAVDGGGRPLTASETAKYYSPKGGHISLAKNLKNTHTLLLEWLEEKK